MEMIDKTRDYRGWILWNPQNRENKECSKWESILGRNVSLELNAKMKWGIRAGRWCPTQGMKTSLREEM
jgi:hypothetical protein